MDEALEHFGVKGMRWGVRKNRDSGTSPDHARAKKVAKVAGAAALVGGAAVAVYVLNKNGHLPVKHLNISKTNTLTKRIATEEELRLQERVTRNTMEAAAAQAARAAQTGHEAVGKIKSEAWHKTVNEVMKGIDAANASQDAWLQSVNRNLATQIRTGSGR